MTSLSESETLAGRMGVDLRGVDLRGVCADRLDLDGLRITFVGVALTLNFRSGDSATFLGDDNFVGDRLTGDRMRNCGGLMGEKFILLGDSSDGMSDRRLLARRVDRLINCLPWI